MHIRSQDILQSPPLESSPSTIRKLIDHMKGSSILDFNRENDCVQKRNGLLVVLRTNLLDSEGASVDHVVGRARGFIEFRSWMARRVRKSAEY